MHYPRPPSQQVSQIVWQRLHCSFCRISISGPPQAGQAGRLLFAGETAQSVVSDDGNSCSLMGTSLPEFMLTGWFRVVKRQ
jgi:hypothetical protein